MLLYSISSAPEIFQQVIEGLMQGISGVLEFFDDILICGSTEEEYLKALDEALSHLEKVGLRVKQKKCKIMLTSVKYLGYRIDATGYIHFKTRWKQFKMHQFPSRSPNLNLILDFFRTMANSCLTCYLHISTLPVVAKGPTVGIGRTT